MKIEQIFKNPITIFLAKLFIAKSLEFKNKHLKICYNCRVINSVFGQYNTLYRNTSINEVKLGDFTYIAENSKLSKTNVGKFCSIGPDCRIGIGKHPSNTFVSTHPIFFSTLKQSQISFVDKNYFEEYKEINIGNDVWIGANAIIVDGVNVSDGAIIAAGAVVTKDIPPFAIVGGVPSKIIKYRFTKSEIDKLLKIKWWNNEINVIKKNVLKYHNISEFLKSIPS